MSMIGKIRKGSFYPLYAKLIDGSPLTTTELTALIAIAIECQRSNDEISRDLGYRILVNYALRFNDFEPLLHIASAEGYAPLVDGILDKLPDDKKSRMGEFSLELLDASLELYESEGIILTNDQWELRDYFQENEAKDVAIAAPTSFGKSELIIDYCRRRQGNKICIIVPTKALIAQTRRRLLSASEQFEGLGYDWKPKIVMHPEANWAARQDAICIYTQERFFRHFVNFSDEVFSDIFVDEAHNLFGKQARELLLSQVLTLHSSRADALGADVRVKYFTPFLADPKNVALKYRGGSVEGRRVKRNVKSELFYVYNLKSNKALNLYDQFFDKMVHIKEETIESVEEYIVKKSSLKNIIYQNRPIKIEAMVKKLFENLPAVDDDDELNVAVAAIKEYIHSDYLLAEALQRGIVYHHGSVPDVVKLYMEELFSKLASVKFVVCNSTLLEGVNIPATRLFLPTVGIGRGVLNASQFKNLIGRVCRYREIFSGGEINEELLLPQIHLVVNDQYMHSNINPRNFLRDRVRVDKKDKDVNENPLVELNSDKLSEEETAEAETFLDVIDPTVREVETVRSARTSVGYKSFIHNIREIDILQYEKEIEADISQVKTVTTVDEFLKVVSDVFLSRTSDNPKNYEIRRLLEAASRDFYAMLLRWRIDHLPFVLMVKNFVDYWDTLDDPVFVGRWGDFQREGEHFERWVNISEKSDAEKVNLAIVRIQDEYEFIETFLAKYVELFHDLSLLEDKLYFELKYGTDDKFEIELIKAGFNNNLAKRLLEDYSEYVSLVDDGGQHLVFEDELVNVMEANGENPISIFETKLMAGL